MAKRVLGSGAAAMEGSAQGFGCMGITAWYGKPLADADAVALLKRAFELGITHWDTAEVYQGKNAAGELIYNETVVGKGVAAVGDRGKLQIATKFHPSCHDGEMSPEVCVAACKASCERLGVDYVDLYYVHRFHPKLSAEDQAKAMLAVQHAGLAKHIGVSEFSPKSLRAFHAVCPVTAVQQEWSLMNRDLEEDLLPVCRELGVGVVAYSPLSRSILSDEVADAGQTTPQAAGDADDVRAARYPRLNADNLPKNAEIARGVRALAKERGLSLAQLSLAWVASQGDDVVPIPGTTKLPHLGDNAKAMGVVLVPAEADLVQAAVPLDKVAGARFTAGDAATYKGNL
mmetsp:Transcript_10528/g.27069  ORF Transcript_10528/g.27069 Transcript_10528/m.27069 type:complete len:344 (-) Transcript_10528:50-1081(-)